jgi:hypothetical protein
MCQCLLSEWESHPGISRAAFAKQFEQKFAGIGREELYTMSCILERSRDGKVTEEDSIEVDTPMEGAAIKSEVEEVDLETMPPSILE